MANGWKLSMALIAKHFGKLGDSISEALASFDPETATEVDRENLQAKMREIALKLAGARQAFKKEQEEFEKLAALIVKDEKAAEILIGKFERGEIDEQTLNEFADNLEAERQQLPIEEAEAKESKELVDTLEDILKTIEQKLNDFDRRAKEAMRAIAMAKAEEERQRLRLQQQEEVRALQSGAADHSSALNALASKAAKLRTQAEASRIVADIGQKPIDRANAVEEARKIAAGDLPEAKESAADRLRRLTSKPAA